MNVNLLRKKRICLLLAFFISFCAAAVLPAMHAQGSITADSSSKKVIRMLKKVTEEDLKKAVSYHKNFLMQSEAAGQRPSNYPVILYKNRREDIQVYGYISAKHGTQGLIICCQETYSYFDIFWNWFRKPSFSVSDFDNDGMPELAYTSPYGWGTGVSTSILTVFDISKNHRLAAYPLTDADLKQQLDACIHWDKEHGIVSVVQDGIVRKKIDLHDSPEYAGHEEDAWIEYMNIYSYTLKNGKITLQTAIMGFIYPSACMSTDDMSFQVLFQDGTFRLQAV